MPTVSEVLMMSFAFWLLVYIGWLLFSPTYREQQAAGWRRMGQPHFQNYITYAMFVVIGGLWSTQFFEPDYVFSAKDLYPPVIGIGGIVGLTVTLRRRSQR